MTLLTTPPLYDNGAIIKLALMRDPTIGRAEMPAVNRVSAALKNAGTILADALSDEDMDIIQAGIGDCNAGYTLREVLQALILTAKFAGDIATLQILEAMQSNPHLTETLDIPYGDVRGNPSLITGVKGFLDTLLGFEVRDYVTITHGGRSAAFLALKAMQPFMMARLKERGIEGMPMIAVPVETWGTYPNIIEDAFGPGCYHPIICPGGLLSAELLDEACTKNPRICALMFCNPVNPSGLTYGSDRMANIARVAYKHRLGIHADDMYALFAWRRGHRSILRAAAALAHSGEEEAGKWVATHTTMMTGVMKAGGSGTRVNFTIIPDSDLRSRFVAIQGNLYGPPNMLGQMLQLAFILNGGPERVWHEMLERRNCLQTQLERIQNALQGASVTLEWSSMEGGFYTGARLKGVAGMQYTDHSGRVRKLDTGENLVFALLELCGVIVSPDSAACIQDVEFFRIAYGSMKLEVIEKMADQIIKGLDKLLAMNGQPRLRVVNG